MTLVRPSITNAGACPASFGLRTYDHCLRAIDCLCNWCVLAKPGRRALGRLSGLLR